MISESATSSILHDWLLFSGDDWRFLFEGFTKSPCTIPCSIFHTRTKYISRVKEIYNDKFRVKLFFIPEMQVSNIAVTITTITLYRWPRPTSSSPHSVACSQRVFFLKFNQNLWCRLIPPKFLHIQSSLINETLNVQVGGSIGLWLGLSVVQGVQLLGNLVTLFRNLPKVLKDSGLSLISWIPI